MGQVGIGTPNQYFNLEFDIASADTWVRVTNANCSHNTKCPKDLRAFVPEESISFDKSPNVTWNLDFSNGIQVNGTLSTDAIQVAGFVAERQTIGLADSFQGFKKDDGIDGSFGLGLMELTFHGDRTPIENFIRAGSMRSEVGVWLGRGNQGGELIFGGRDRGRYYGDINYYNLPRDSVYWAIPVESITVVSNQLNDDGSNQRTFRSDTITSKVGNSTVPPNVIFDTSTNIIMLPPNIALQVHRHIHNYFFGFYSGYSLVFGHYTVPCSLGDMETDIWIDLGPSVPKASVPTPIPTPTPKPTNHSTLVPPAGLPSPLPRSLPSPQPRAKGQDENVTGASQNMRFRISGSDLVRERLPVFGGLIDVCYSGIQASKSESDDWVFGNIWFMNNYMTFDHHHRQIGVAPAVQS
ncbi:hypothetical protein BGX31_009824 [Mortierella sp. GBA43]|nr:hypothetical protein BGX31_009824 [Mortierella sp. GBA43]